MTSSRLLFRLSTFPSSSPPLSLQALLLADLLDKLFVGGGFHAALAGDGDQLALAPHRLRPHPSASPERTTRPAA